MSRMPIPTDSTATGDLRRNLVRRIWMFPHGDLATRSTALHPEGSPPRANPPPASHPPSSSDRSPRYLPSCRSGLSVYPRREQLNVAQRSDHSNPRSLPIVPTSRSPSGRLRPPRPSADRAAGDSTVPCFHSSTVPRIHKRHNAGRVRRGGLKRTPWSYACSSFSTNPAFLRSIDIRLHASTNTSFHADAQRTCIRLLGFHGSMTPRVS